MKFTKVLAATFCSLLLFAGCSVNNKAIVTVNGEAITKADYDKVMDAVKNNVQYEDYDWITCKRKNCSRFNCKKTS